MAEALGIEPILARFNSRAEIAQQVFRIVRREQDHYGKTVPISIVIALEDDADVRLNPQIEKARALATGTLFLTRTESDNAEVHQNNRAIGDLIARCMVRDLAPAISSHPHRNKVLMIDADLGPLSSFKVRKHKFALTLEELNSGLTLLDDRVRITQDEFFSSGVVEKVRAETAAILKRDKANEITAIYAGYFSLTWGTIVAARETGRTPADLSIYSERDHLASDSRTWKA